MRPHLQPLEHTVLVEQPLHVLDGQIEQQREGEGRSERNAHLRPVHVPGEAEHAPAARRAGEVEEHDWNTVYISVSIFPQFFHMIFNTQERTVKLLKVLWKN